MTSRRFCFERAGVLSIVLGLAVPACAQKAGPLPPVAANQASPQGSSAPIPPQQGSAAAPSTAASVSIAPQDATSTASPSSKIEVPTGTHIPLVLHNAISTRSARSGDPVYFETLFPVMIGGHVAIPAGSYVSGEVTESKRPGRVKGRGELMVRLTTLILPNAYMVNLNAAPSGAGTGGNESVNNEGKIVGDSDKASDVGTVMKTTGAGAGIGAIAGQSAKGAGIGAGAGAAIGLATVLLSRGPEAELPRGSTLEAVIERPIFLDADKVQFTTPGQSSTLAGPPNREPERFKVPF
jgi:hypothetical protein